MADDDCIAEPSLQGLRLAAGDGSERRAMFRPDQAIGLGGLAGPGGENNAAQDRLPSERRDFDDAAVREKLGELGANCPRLRRVGGAEVDQENADIGH